MLKWRFEPTLEDLELNLGYLHNNPLGNCLSRLLPLFKIVYTREKTILRRDGVNWKVGFVLREKKNYTLPH